MDKASFLNDYLLEKRVGICFLQETHIDNPCHIEKLEEIFTEFSCFFTLNSSKTKGVGILSKKSFNDILILDKFYDIDSRFLCIELEFEAFKISLINF